MGRKKRRSSKFRDSSTVIDMEQARKERQERQQARQQKKKKMEAKNKTPRSEKNTQTMQRQDMEAELRARGLLKEQDAPSGHERQEASGESQSRPRPAASDVPGGLENGVRQNRRKMALRRRRRSRNLIILGVFVGLFIIVGFSVGQILVLQHDLHTAKKQQIEYIEQKAQMEKDLQEIDDLENLEEQARNQMRLVKPGETLYIFPENIDQEQQ